MEVVAVYAAKIHSVDTRPTEYLLRNGQWLVVGGWAITRCGESRKFIVIQVRHTDKQSRYKATHALSRPVIALLVEKINQSTKLLLQRA
jgi:hypothetical protein